MMLGPFPLLPIYGTVNRVILPRCYLFIFFPKREAHMSDLSSYTNPDLGISKKATKNYAAYVFWVMFSISFLNYLDRNVLSGAANIIAHELGFGVDGIGYIASAFLIVYSLATVPLGMWADRAKRKDVVAICVAIW